MGDPLSIAAGCLAVLSAAKAVGDLIADIVAAPEVLQQAKMDVGATATSVQSLSSYVNTTGETSLAGKEQLRAVLSSCETTCSQFSSSLRKFTKHSKAIDGKMSVLDRGALVLKKREVESFRRDIGCQRQAINVAAIPLSLYGSKPCLTLYTIRSKLMVDQVKFSADYRCCAAPNGSLGRGEA